VKSEEVGVSFWDVVGPERETDGDVVHGIGLRSRGEACRRDGDFY
jgi:hypothetical protein